MSSCDITNKIEASCDDVKYGPLAVIDMQMDHWCQAGVFTGVLGPRVCHTGEGLHFMLCMYLCISNIKSL